MVSSLTRFFVVVTHIGFMLYLLTTVITYRGVVDSLEQLAVLGAALVYPAIVYLETRRLLWLRRLDVTPNGS